MPLIFGTLCSTPLPWLPVLSNIEPPALRRKAVTDKLVEKIVKHDSWPIHTDIFNPPLLRLTSRKPMWLNLQPVDIKSRWRHDWKSTQVVTGQFSQCATPQSDNRVSTCLGNSGLCWTVFARNRDTAVPAEGNGDLQTVFVVHWNVSFWSVYSAHWTHQRRFCDDALYKLTFTLHITYYITDSDSVSLWRDPDDVLHCRIQSPDKTEWRLISATLYSCGWWRCFVAGQLWFVTRIREKEE